MKENEVGNGVSIAVVIPSFKVKQQILEVIEHVGPECIRIYVVDDCCPEFTGEFIKANCSDPRVIVLHNKINLGVGGAVIAGYKAAIEDGFDVIVKVDGDGQMDPRLIPDFVGPIVSGEADYTKGNRFFDLEKIGEMPKVRLFGNAALSFMTKVSSGYWELFDPTNGYTAIHRDVARHLPFGKISNRYFFESDMLFRLNILRAVVVDIPMDARYGNEISNLQVSKVIPEFLKKNVYNFIKRIFYNYYLRDMSVASIELPLGIIMFTFGLVFGAYHWIFSWLGDVSTPTGTIMVSAISLLMGLQFLLAFVSSDMASSPKRPLHLRASSRRGR